MHIFYFFFHFYHFLDVSTLITAEIEEKLEDSQKITPKPAKVAKIQQKVDEIDEKQPKMKVERGKVEKIHKQKLLNDAGESKKLQEMMIPKKQRRVYHKIKKKQKHISNEVNFHYLIEFLGFFVIFSVNLLILLNIFLNFA